MKTLVFATLALLFFVAVESLNLKGLEVELTKAIKPQELKPLTSEKRNFVNQALSVEKRALYARQQGAPYQPMLLVSADGENFFYWVDNKDYTFGIEESAGDNFITGSPITKFDLMFPIDGEPGYYGLVTGFYQEDPDLLETNDQNIDIMVHGMGFTTPDSGTHLNLPLPFSNAIVADADIIFTIDQEPYAGVKPQEIVLNEEGNEIITAVGGTNGVSGQGYDGVFMVIILVNPLETTPSEGTDVTVTFFPTNEGSGDTDLPTTFKTESFTHTTVAPTSESSSESSSESQSESQATQTSQTTSQTQATSETPSSTDSESSDSATEATSEATGTQTSQQQSSSPATSQAATSEENESGAVGVVASVFVMVSALMVQFA